MMTHLSIYLLGSFQVSLDRVPVRSFESRKVGALLAYLAAESDHTHPRGKLAGLLWSERPEANARRGLSQALYNLRTAIGDRQSPTPFLIVSRQTVQFDLVKPGRGRIFINLPAFDKADASQAFPTGFEGDGHPFRFSAVDRCGKRSLDNAQVRRK